MSSRLNWPTAALPQKIVAGQIHLWAWQSHSLGPVNSADIALLDEQERSRLQRFYHQRDRTRFALAHANRRRILGAYINTEPERLVFRTGTFGKPEILTEARTRPLYFNLSYSRNVALLALSMDTEVGVDIEDIRPVERAVSETHFSLAELSALASLEGQAWLQGFYHCWTRKEAILKAEGVGLNMALHSFDVSLIPGVPAKLIAARPAAAFREPWTLYNLSPAPGTAAALAAGGPHAEVSCFRLEETPVSATSH